MFEHLSAYKNPEEQKFLIGVVLMVPCYAVESVSFSMSFCPFLSGLAEYKVFCLQFVSMVHPAISVDVGIARDCYESFAMYCFGRYLIACLGGEERAIEFMRREGRAGMKAPLLDDHGHERGIVRHPFPMNYILKPWKLGQWVFQVIKFGIVQYMIIKALTAISAVILEAFDVYCEGDFKWNCGYPYMAVVLNFRQMGLASVVHLYVFPATPYELMGDRFSGSVAVLGDYASVDCPLDPDEVRDSERPTKLRLPQPDYEARSGMTIRESVKDVFLGGGEYVSIVSMIVNDVKFTVTQAVEPVEKGITKFNQKLHKISENIKKEKRTKDDSCISSAKAVIRGIDDPLLIGSFSDSSSSSKRKKHRRKSGYTSAESGNESSIDTAFGGYKIHGRRWLVKD
ncbi:hypothetical protein SASPL_157735 [Salvia splendens]|uniref:Protein LAZ1 n=1 Tax=Salvia splendens TaxID=180675 RepID=A0A8X8VUG7_SALSN|nr:hypothetical protein SASPL_157735 [Salvia splendens]